MAIQQQQAKTFENKPTSETRKQISRAIDARAAPPVPPPPKGMWKEFMDFISKYKVMGLAVAHGEDDIRELGFGFPV